MPLGMPYLVGRDGRITTGPPQGGYTTFGGDPETAQPAKRIYNPQQGSSLGKYPWLIGDPPASQKGPQTNDFGVALGQKGRPAAAGASAVVRGRSAGPGKGQNNNLFGQPFKVGIF